MDRKVMRKLLMGMAIFFSHIFIKKQATDHPHTTLHPSSVLNPLPLLTKFDNVPHEFPVCFKSQSRFCENAKDRKEFGLVILNVFEYCLNNQRNLNDPYYILCR